MNEEFVRELQRFVREKADTLRQWLKPNPEDTVGVRIFKSFYKTLAVLLLIIFSPVICLILTIAFLAAF